MDELNAHEILSRLNEFSRNLENLREDIHIIKDSQNSANQLVTIDIIEASRMLKVSQQCIYNWVSQGKIPYIKMNGRLLFDRSEIELLIIERRKNGNERKRK